MKPGKRVSRLFFENEGYVLHINAPAIEGKANNACVKFLAKFFGLSASSVELVQGNTSSFKRFKFYGLSDTDANLRLEPLKIPQPYQNKTND